MEGQAQSNSVTGFTLIELVITLILLAILAVVALPKFVDLSSEAKAASLQGLSGAINSAAALQHNKAVIKAADGGLENGFISDGILFDQGYPVALDFDVPFGSFGSGDGTPEILEAVEIDLNEWTFNTVINGSEDGQITRELYITLRQVIADGAAAAEIIATNCYVSYDSFLLVQRPPVVKTFVTGC